MIISLLLLIFLFLLILFLGFIGAFSAGVGEGSIFYVELPLYVRGFCHAGNIRHPPRPVLRRGNSSSSKRDFASEILFHSSRKSDATRSFVEDAHMIFEMTNRMSSRSFNRQDDGKSSSCRDECIHNIRETEYECGEVTRAASSAVLSLKVETGRSQDKTDLKKRILVVDDSAATRKIMSRVLSNKGYHVDTAYDGVDCLRIVQENITKCEVAYSIIIMDDNMPNLSGPDACKILRTNGYIGMLCGVTGNVSDADILNFKNQGATVVLPKPLDMNVLESLFSEFGI